MSTVRLEMTDEEARLLLEAVVTEVEESTDRLESVMEEPCDDGEVRELRVFWNRRLWLASNLRARLKILIKE